MTAFAAKSRMDNPPAVGAPKNWPWGYLQCGCSNDGYGRHADYGLPPPAATPPDGSAGKQ